MFVLQKLKETICVCEKKNVQFKCNATAGTVKYI